MSFLQRIRSTFDIVSPCSHRSHGHQQISYLYLHILVRETTILFLVYSRLRIDSNTLSVRRHIFYSTVCFDNFNKDRFCPVCLRTYRGDTGDEESGDEDDNNMVCCDECNRWVHMECDGQLTEAKVEEMGKDESLKYTCPVCLNRAVLLPGTGSTDLDPAEASLSLQGTMAPQPKACGMLETTPVRGMLMHKGKKLGVPVIVGTGVEYDRTLITQLLERRTTPKSRKRSHRQAAIERALSQSATGPGAGASSSSKSRKSRSPVKRRVSVASSTSSLSSVSYISDN